MGRVDIKSMTFDIKYAVRAALKAYVEPDIVNGKLPRVDFYDAIVKAARDAAVEYAMVHCNNRQIHAAKVLGLTRNTVHTYLVEAGKLKSKRK